MSETSRAVVLQPGEGRTFPFGQRPVRVLVESAAAEGGIAVFEGSPEPGGPVPPPHRHHAYEEVFYILEGEMEFRLDDEVVRAGAGAAIAVPRGVAHSFANPGPGAARMLVMLSPAHALALVEGHAALVSAGGPPDPVKLQALYAQHYSELLEP